MSVDYIARVIRGIEITEAEFDEIEENNLNCAPFNVFWTENGYYFGTSLGRIDLNYDNDKTLKYVNAVDIDALWEVAEEVGIADRGQRIEMYLLNEVR